MKRLILGAFALLLLANPAEPQAPAGSTSPPTPAPSTVRVPPGQPLPPRQWVERPMPTTGCRSDGVCWGAPGWKAVAYMQAGGKHGRTFYHPGLKQMVFAGGDWKTSMPESDIVDFSGAEIWSLDVSLDKWTLRRPFCVPGAIQPNMPDNVGWAFDPKPERSGPLGRAIMTPGFYGMSGPSPANSCGDIRGLWGYGAYAFGFDTGKFTGPDDLAGLPPPQGKVFMPWSGDEGSLWLNYDSVTDEIVRVFNQPLLEQLNLGTKVWRRRPLVFSQKSFVNGLTPHRDQQVIDIKGRAVYFLAPYYHEDKNSWTPATAKPSLIKVNLDTAAVAVITLPPQYVMPNDGSQERYLVFDTKNRLVLIPNNTFMGSNPIQGLGIYHVDTGQWEWEAVPPTVMGSVWGFDESVGALIGAGKRIVPSSYYLYKYGTNAPALPPPVSTPTPPPTPTQPR